MEFENNLKLNNLFDKDNYLNGFNKVRSQKLPFGENTDGSLDIDEISLGEDQIVFASVNNIFNRLLENDIYNEFLLKNQEDNVDLFPGPAIVKDKEYILRRNDENTKYVYINEDTKETEIVRKKPDTLEKSIKYIPLEDSRVNGKTRVNFVERMNGYYIAGTDNGVWFAIKYEGPWKKANERSPQMRRTVGKGLDLLFNGKNVIGFSPNQGFANNDSVLSSYQYVMATSEGGVYGCNPDLQWEIIPQLVLPEGVEINKIFSDEDTGKLYILTKNGMYEYYGRVNEKLRFAYGLDGFSTNDFTKLDKDEEHEDSNKLISTHRGIKQSETAMCFKDMVAERQFDSMITTIEELHNHLFVGTLDGLYVKDGDSWNKILESSINGIACYGTILFVATTNGLYYCSFSNVNSFKADNAVRNLNITHIVAKDNLICFSVADSNMVYVRIVNDNQVTKLLKDDGTETEGLNLGSSSNVINDFYCKNNDLYAITKEKIYYLSEENISQFNFQKIDSIGNKEITFFKTVGSKTYVCFKNGSKYRLCDFFIVNSNFDVDDPDFTQYIEFDDPVVDIVASVSPASDLFSLRYIVTENDVYSFNDFIDFTREDPSTNLTKIISYEDTNGIKSFCSVYFKGAFSGDKILYNTRKTGDESKIFSKVFKDGTFIDSDTYNLTSGWEVVKVLSAPNQRRLFAIGKKIVDGQEQSILFEFPIQLEFALQAFDSTAIDKYTQKIELDTISLDSDGTNLSAHIGNQILVGHGSNIGRIRNFPSLYDFGYLYAGTDDKLHLFKKRDEDISFADTTVYPEINVKNVDEIRNYEDDYTAYLFLDPSKTKIKYIDSDFKATKFSENDFDDYQLFSHFYPINESEAFVWTNDGNLSILTIASNTATEFAITNYEEIKHIKLDEIDGKQKYVIATNKNVYTYGSSGDEDDGFVNTLVKNVPTVPSSLDYEDRTDEEYELLSTLQNFPSSTITSLANIEKIEDVLIHSNIKKEIDFYGINVDAYPEDQVSSYDLSSFVGNVLDNIVEEPITYVVSKTNLLNTASNLSSLLSGSSIKIDNLNYNPRNNREIGINANSLSTWIRGIVSAVLSNDTPNDVLSSEISVDFYGLSTDIVNESFVIDGNSRTVTITDLDLLSARNNPLIVNLGYETQKYSTVGRISEFSYVEESEEEIIMPAPPDDPDAEYEQEEESSVFINKRILVNASKSTQPRQEIAFNVETSAIVNLNALTNVGSLNSQFTIKGQVIHPEEEATGIDIVDDDYVYKMAFVRGPIVEDGETYSGKIETTLNPTFAFSAISPVFINKLEKIIRTDDRLYGITCLDTNKTLCIFSEFLDGQNHDIVEFKKKVISWDKKEKQLYLILAEDSSNVKHLYQYDEDAEIKELRSNVEWNRMFHIQGIPLLCRDYVDGNTSTIATLHYDEFGEFSISEKVMKAGRPHQIDNVVCVDNIFYVYDSDSRKLFKASFTDDLKLRMQTSEHLSDVDSVFYTKFVTINSSDDSEIIEKFIAFQKRNSDENKIYYINDSLSHPTNALEIANVLDSTVNFADLLKIFAISDLEKENDNPYLRTDKLFFKMSDPLWLGDGAPSPTFTIGSLSRFETVDFKESNFSEFAAFNQEIRKYRSFDIVGSKVFFICLGNKLLFKVIDNETLSRNTITGGQWREITFKDFEGNAISEAILDATFYQGILYVLTENRVINTNIPGHNFLDFDEDVLIDFQRPEVLNAVHSKSNCQQLFVMDGAVYIGYLDANQHMAFVLADTANTISNRPFQYSISYNGIEKVTDLLLDNTYNFYAIAQTTNSGVHELYVLENDTFVLANENNSRVSQTIDSFCNFNDTIYYIGNGKLLFLGSDEEVSPPSGEQPKVVGTYGKYIYLGTNNGLYRGENKRVTLHVNDEKSISLQSAINYSAAIEFFSNDLTYTYSEENIDDGTKDMYPTISRIHSTDTHLKEYDIENRTVYPATILKNVSGFLLMSTGSYTRIYNSQKERNHDSYVSEVYQQALEKLVEGSFFITTVSKVGDRYYLGYGPHLVSFSGFEEIDFYRPAYGDLRYLKMHYNRRVNRLLKIDNQNFLVGLQNGVRYFKDGQMNLNFVDRKHPERTISTPVSVIEEISKSDSEPEYMVVSKGKFYSNDTLVGKAFTKILDLEDIKDIPQIKGESVTCIRVFGKNNYLIGTTNGILCSRLTYTLFDEMHIITFKEIKDKIKAAWTKAFDEHMNTEHAEDQLVPRLQRKEDSDLSNFPNSFVSPIEYLRTSKSIQGYTSDIIDTIEYDDENHYIRGGITNWVIEKMAAEAPYSFDGFYSKMEDPNDSTLVDMMDIPYISMKWLSGMRDIYIYVPTTMTYYKNSPFGFSHSESASSMFPRLNFVGAGNQRNFIHTSCTKLRIYLDNAHFRIKQIHSIEVNGNSLPLKIYRENEAAEDEVKRGREMNGHQLYDSVVLPTVCRTLPRTTSNATDNVNSITDNFNRICLDFSVYGTDSQSIHIITE